MSRISWIKSLKAIALCLGLLITFSHAYAQETGQLRGDLTVNTAIYNQDSTVGTYTTQYFHQKSSAEAWLYLSYSYKGYQVNTRFDMFNNSPLLVPQEAYTRQGLAFYNLMKTVGKLEITVGHFYDQFGSGSVFRAFEDRNIGLDYAVQGLRLKLNLTDSFYIKGFTGLQKQRFDEAPQVLKGLNAEKISGIGKVSLNTGIAFSNRTLDQSTVNTLSEYINTLPLDVRRANIPKYNVYAISAYNTAVWKDFSLYTEAAYKTKELVYVESEQGVRNLENADGKLGHAVLNYATRGFGASAQARYVDRFILRTSPYTNFLVGIYNYLPPISRQTSWRLPARYSISALPQGEKGYSFEAYYSINKRNTFNANYSRVDQLSGGPLYREIYVDYSVKFNKRTKAIFGVQHVEYNQQIYQGKPAAPMVRTICPLAEFSLRLANASRMNDTTVRGLRALWARAVPSIRFEAQYLRTMQDKGDFLWVLAELNLAPHYSFSVSDMINTVPTQGDKMVHYYNFFATYTINQTRFSVTYARQVEGVVCTGGVCRVEPAFSGLRFNLVTNF